MLRPASLGQRRTRPRTVASAPDPDVQKLHPPERVTVSAGHDQDLDRRDRLHFAGWCPRCCISPLRFVASGDCSDSTGGGVYSCCCGYTTARDQLVMRLLRELGDVSRLFEDLAQLALPRFAQCRCRPDDPALDSLHDLAELLGARPGVTR